MKLEAYDQSLLNGWEEVFKKGQLTLWIFLALKDGDKHMTQIKTFITDATNGVVSADDISIYRALRRYVHADMIISNITVPGNSGPERKVYELTNTGKNVLHAFCDRNITKVFYKPEIKSLIEKDA